ncbi:MAG TPA: kelch repeat-containing protein, partial [Kofleriaceae bacterium]|nr:kelch repeat-containing protein [Kofleriaceae bacterium]
PPARIDAGFAFDGRRAILFGGFVSSLAVDETWAWDGSAWMQLHPAHAPPPRFDMAIGGDPIRNQIVVFGGSDDTALGDTWVWDGDDWSERTTTPSPPACTGARMTWDPRRRHLVLFGGRAGTALDAVWEWDGAAWSRLSVANAPPGRYDEAWFPVRDGLVAFGGFPTQIGRGGLDDTWLLRWDNAHPDEACHFDVDDDGDGLAGCADPDCWSVCTPACPPGVSCAGTTPRCGDGVCDPIEDCRICPADCACTPVCGDFICDPGEDHLSCPGDC